MGGFNGGGEDGLDFRRADFRSPAVVKEAFLTVSESLRQLFAGQLAQRKRAETVAGEVADRDGQLLAAISRIENQSRIVLATVETTAARVSRLEAAETAPNGQELQRLRAEVQEIRRNSEAEDRQFAVMMAKQETHIQELRRRFTDVEDDLSETGQRYISDIIRRAEETKAKTLQLEASNAAFEAQRRASSNDLQTQIALEQREVRKEDREDRRHWWRWLGGLVGAIVLLVASWLLGQQSGKASVAPLPVVPALPSTAR